MILQSGSGPVDKGEGLATYIMTKEGKCEEQNEFKGSCHLHTGFIENILECISVMDLAVVHDQNTVFGRKRIHDQDLIIK